MLSPEALASIINHNSQTLNSESGQQLVNSYKVDPNSIGFDDLDYESSSEETTFRGANSKKLNEIKASMTETPPMEYDDSPTAFLDNVASSKPRVVKKQITESYIPQQASATIDYSIIKAIIKDTISEYFKENDNTLKQIGLSEGKIRLVDNKGNVYSAELKYAGNIKDKKK